MTKFICFSALHHLAALKKQDKQPNKKNNFLKKHCDQYQKQTHQQEQVYQNVNKEHITLTKLDLRRFTKSIWERQTDKQKTAFKVRSSRIDDSQTLRFVKHLERLSNVFPCNKIHGYKSEENPKLLDSKMCYLSCNGSRITKHVQIWKCALNQKAIKFLRYKGIYPKYPCSL